MAKGIRSYEEEEEQCCFIKWLSAHKPKLFACTFAVPNGGFRSAREAGRLKMQGVKPGVSDLIILYPTKKFHGLLIEAKRLIIKGRPKPLVAPQQQGWANLMNSLGYRAVICYGFEEMVKAVREYDDEC